MNIDYLSSAGDRQIEGRASRRIVPRLLNAKGAEENHAEIAELSHHTFCLDMDVGYNKLLGAFLCDFSACIPPRPLRLNTPRSGPAPFRDTSEFVHVDGPWPDFNRRARRGKSRRERRAKPSYIVPRHTCPLQ